MKKGSFLNCVVNGQIRCKQVRSEVGASLWLARYPARPEAEPYLRMQKGRRNQPYFHGKNLKKPELARSSHGQTHPLGVVAALFIILALFSSAGCRTPPVATRPDAEIERNVAMARSAYTAGAVDKAAGYYQKALQRARVMDASAEIARNAYNLAACLAALGSYDQAKACLDEARLEFERNNLPCPELPLLSARIARASGNLQEAESLARSQLVKRQELNAALQVQWQLLMAEIKCDQSKAVEAEVELLAITPRQLQACGAEIKAEMALTQARVQLLRRDLPEAARQYDAAAGHWQSVERYNEMAAALHHAARAYEAAGNSAAAADRYYRAARSLFESGQTSEARELARAVEKLAGAAKASALQKQANRLQTEIDLQIQKAQTSAK